MLWLVEEEAYKKWSWLPTSWPEIHCFLTLECHNRHTFMTMNVETLFEFLHRIVNLMLKKAIKFYLHFAVILKNVAVKAAYANFIHILYTQKNKRRRYNTCGKYSLPSRNCYELSPNEKNRIKSSKANTFSECGNIVISSHNF